MAQRSVRTLFVPRQLLLDEPARRAFMQAVMADARAKHGDRLRLRVRVPTEQELRELVVRWRVPYIAAARSRVTLEVLTR